MKKNQILLSALVLASAIPFAGGAEKIRFEAEDVIVSRTKLPEDKFNRNGWDLWSTDPNKKSWSGEKTLRSGEVKAEVEPGKTNRELIFSIPVKKSGTYILSARIVRNLGISVDGGKNWRNVSRTGQIMPQKKFNAGDKITVLISPCYVTPQNRGAVYVDYFDLEEIDGSKTYTPTFKGRQIAKNGTFRYEAEDVIVSHPAMTINSFGDNGWEIWTLDKNPEIWSGGRTLRTYAVKKATEPGKSGRELKFSIPVKKEGLYNLRVRCGRDTGFSLDGGKSWQRISDTRNLFTAKKFKANDKIEVIVSACYLSSTNPGSLYLDYFDLIPIPPSTLQNPGFLGKTGKDGAPAGWSPYSSNPGELKISHSPGEVEIEFGEKSGFWLLSNQNELYGAPGDLFRVTAKVTNTGDIKCSVTLQYVGLVNRRIVNHSVDQNVTRLNKGESAFCTSQVAMPTGLEALRFRFVGGTPRSKVKISDVKFEFLGNVLDVAKKAKFSFIKNGKLNWSADNAKISATNNGSSLKVVSEPGKQWTIRSLETRPAMRGEGINVSFSIKADSKNAKFRMRVRSYADKKQAHLALNNAEWIDVTEKTVSLSIPAFTPSSQCDTLALEFDGCGDVTLSDLDVTRIETYQWPEREIKKVPIPSYPARKAKLSRGVTVRPMGDGRLYVSWRLTSQDADNIAFDVFSYANGKQTKLNKEPITQTTDFIVEKPLPKAAYIVSPAAGFSGKSGSASPDKRHYRTYKLSGVERRPYSIVPADLDGDGEFDYVVRSSVTNIDPILYFDVTKTPHYFIEAFHRDGRRLWSKDLGGNIETGVWFTPYTAADLDGDGKAEVICKASADTDGSWLETEGWNKNKVMSGPEYVVVFDGMTGKEIARAPWPERRPYYQSGYYAHNYFARNMMAIFRPDGKTDCILALRGTYTYMQAEAWKLENGKLVSLWKYNNHGLGRKWWGQGSHNTRIADVDGDGRDEVMLGAALLDDDGSPLWTTGHGHPDYLFVGDITKKNPGLEVVTIYESRGNIGGFTCADAKTGKVVWELKKPHKHIHRGYAADMDPRYRGWEVGGADSIYGGHNGPLAEYHWSPDGELLGKDADAPYAQYRPFIPHFAYWDADLQKEVIERQMRDHRGGDCGGQLVEGQFFAQFDSDGDWREEIAIARRGEFRIYGTTIPAMDRRHSLMEDEVYRKSVLANSSGYLFDPSMGILLTDNAVNLNLTVLAKTPGTMEVVVSAPMKEAVEGKLKLTAPDKVKLSRSEWDIKLAPAEIKTLTVKIENPDNVTSYIRAELKLANGKILRGQVPAASLKNKPSKAKLSGIYVQAENYHAERGGKVLVRSDKSGVSGRCFTHWDAKGHAVAWKMQVPADGKYTLQIRYCNNKNVKRKLFCNGVDRGIIDIKSSDAVSGGELASDWATANLVQLDLKKGTVTIELENVDNQATNMDYLKLIPVKK